MDSNIPQTKLKLQIPYAEYVKMQKVQNPELSGSIGQFGAEKHLYLSPNDGRGLFRDKTTVIRGDIDPKFIEGSPTHQKTTLDSIRQFRKSNPKLVAAAEKEIKRSSRAKRALLHFKKQGITHTVVDGFGELIFGVKDGKRIGKLGQQFVIDRIRRFR